MTYRVHPLAPVVAVDIDGTLGDYHGHLTWFASMYLQEEVTTDWADEFEGDFSSALGLDKRTYRDIKLAYRQGGMKRSMPVFSYAKAAIEEIRSQNIQVWIATTRPYNRLDNIDPDTQFWLNRNIGKVDGVIYGEEKYLDLIDIVGTDRILGVIDDIPDNVIQARGLGLNAVLMRGPHNEYLSRKIWPDRIRINGPSEIFEFVYGWAAEHAETEEEDDE